MMSGWKLPAISRERARAASKRVLRVGAVLIALICFGCLAWQIAGLSAGGAGTTITEADGRSREEVQAELDRLVQENMMTVSLAPTAQLDDEGNLRVNVINDEENSFPQRFSVIQNDRQLYRSSVIEPGECIEFCRVEDIEVGDAYVEIQALDRDTNMPHGNPTRVKVSVVKKDG